jgi:hypothetical protein
MRLYEVVDLVPGVSVTLRNVLDDTRVTVHERQGSRSMRRGILIAARIIPRGQSGQPEIERGLLMIPDLIGKSTISQLASHRQSHRAEHPQASETAFFKEMVPFFHDAWMTSILDPPIPRLANTDGEDLIETFVRFEVSDSAGLAAALDGAKDLDRDADGKTAWLWSGKNQEGKIVHLGRLVLEGKSLALECNSVRSGERGRAMIEVVAGYKVCHRATTHEDIKKKVRDAIRLRCSGGAPEPSPDELPRAVQEALVLDALARHYRKWIDDQIPALDDHTPRQAAANASLRPKLAELIRGLEGLYQQALMDGEPAYDPSWMWSELGIEDRTRLAYPPALAHERMASMVPGLGELCRRVAENLRRQPGFDDASTTVSADEIRTNIDIQRFLRENKLPETPSQGPNAPGLDNLSIHLEVMINFRTLDLGKARFRYFLP